VLSLPCTAFSSSFAVAVCALSLSLSLPPVRHPRARVPPGASCHLAQVAHSAFDAQKAVACDIASGVGGVAAIKEAVFWQTETLFSQLRVATVLTTDCWDGNRNTNENMMSNAASIKSSSSPMQPTTSSLLLLLLSACCLVQVRIYEANHEIYIVFEFKFDFICSRLRRTVTPIGEFNFRGAQNWKCSEVLTNHLLHQSVFVQLPLTLTVKKLRLAAGRWRY
jgi:hypothetical protein